MNIRIAPVLMLCSAVATLGCSSQPVAPSSLALTASRAPAGGAVVAPDSKSIAASPSRFGSRTPGVVFVTSQGLYYDTFVVKDPLPMKGRFQLIAGGATEFGPGQPGYLGGRWWEDVDGNGIQDPDDHYFLCPLLPPGRPTP
jgi:hypothetical protein